MEGVYAPNSVFGSFVVFMSIAIRANRRRSTPRNAGRDPAFTTGSGCAEAGIEDQ
jgi:hypothetical protein